MSQSVSNLVQDVNCLKAAHNTWNGKCHCEHVESNTVRLANVEFSPKSSNRDNGKGAPAFCGAYGTALAGDAPLMQPPGFGVRGAIGVRADEPAGGTPRCCTVAA